MAIFGGRYTGIVDPFAWSSDDSASRAVCPLNAVLLCRVFNRRKPNFSCARRDRDEKLEVSIIKFGCHNVHTENRRDYDFRSAQGKGKGQHAASPLCHLAWQFEGGERDMIGLVKVPSIQLTVSNPPHGLPASLTTTGCSSVARNAVRPIPRS